MRVLIVDDEVKVCQLISHLIHWEDYGMEIIGMVNDGEQAFEVICREKPDIVITDIRMPGLDGIELVERVSHVLDHVFFVIVSGYSQFEYARQAVKLGVEDYLVKPIRKKDLIAVLEKISGKYTKETKDRSEKEELKTQLVQTKEKVRNNLLQDLLFTRENFFQTAELTEIRERYGCTFAGSCYRMVLVHLYENTAGTAADEREFALHKIQQILKEQLADVCMEFLCIVHGYEVICLLNMQDAEEQVLSRPLVKITTDMSAIREIFPAARCAVVLGHSMTDLKGCRAYLEKMRMALAERFGHETQEIFKEEQLEMKLSSGGVMLSAELRKRLLLESELLHAKGVEDLVDEIRHGLKERKAGAQEILAVYREITGIFLLAIQNYHKDTDMPRTETYMQGLEVYYSLDAVFTWLKNELVEYIETREQEQKDLESRPIRVAKKYIHEHFRENVSLDTVSGEIGLNPAYFSTVFKKSTGQNFMDYVTSVRMEHAKELLTRSNTDVIDIACEVGYADVKYFSKLFKKHTSLTPTEYRKLYS